MVELIIIGVLSIALALVSILYLTRYSRTFTKRRRAKDFYEALSNDDLIHIHTDKFGNKWYTWQDVRMLPPERGLSAELAMHQLDMNIKRADLITWINKILSYANEGKMTSVCIELEKIQDRLTWLCEEQTLEDLALVYLMIEGENLRMPSRKDTKRKKKVFDEDEESRGFFLRLAWKNTNLYSRISETDIMPYLAKKTQESRKKKRYSIPKQ